MKAPEYYAHRRKVRYSKSTLLSALFIALTVSAVFLWVAFHLNAEILVMTLVWVTKAALVFSATLLIFCAILGVVRDMRGEE